jgi:hypothetical protein
MPSPRGPRAPNGSRRIALGASSLDRHHRLLLDRAAQDRHRRLPCLCRAASGWRPAPASGRSASARQAETRAEICERWLPLWRSLTRHQSASPQLHSRIGRVYDLITERLKLMYRPELSTLAEPQSARILIALETLTDFESWGRMRERHGLSAEAACVVWTEAIDRLLSPTPA